MRTCAGQAGGEGSYGHVPHRHLSSHRVERRPVCCVSAVPLDGPEKVRNPDPMDFSDSLVLVTIDFSECKGIRSLRVE
ncbi:hypothetical protein QQF64_020892 [Cirrhinus molitorella]|uniref:Uncharacterized protein n=1 Tax=Cirrhinus molitorella TaxID=172907 RepID=A0ABR3LAH2_9TELE